MGMPSSYRDDHQAAAECERDERYRPCQDVEAFGGRCGQNFLAVLMPIEGDNLRASLALTNHAVDVVAHRNREAAGRHIAVGDRQTAAALAGQTLRNLCVSWSFRCERFT